MVSEYSSRGAAAAPSTWPDLSAPGENITSACRPYLPVCSTGLDFRTGPGLLDVGTSNTISGTSMAAPHVAGIVAQLFQADPTATPAEIEAALKSTTHRYTDGAAYQTVGGYSTSYDKGAGLVDVVAAVEALTGSAEPAAQQEGRRPAHAGPKPRG
ncbi:S8 family serine peptidase [Blastococcus capsensis]|uniref:S8 family serine peptidase n=1 Tax=Blastococcus capsensis TaxID=1564163 RepID=UPI0025410993|nr:S8 family serine peptidase [Blastococcus capsensis]MDK3255222.1 S8 family serine peptidase [Blastococcus capsensis]